jgi:type II secretory pathway pseudopilin PulG
MVVIAIIAILAGLLLPAIANARGKARITQAKTDMNSLKLALKSVESTYGKMVDVSGNFDGKAPESPTGGDAIILGSASGASAAAYDAFIKELSTPNELTAANRNINKRGVKFLDPRDDGWKDPWGNRYRIYINKDYTDKVTVAGATRDGNLFIYSCGPNGGDDGGENPDNTPNSTKDDICGWEN